MIRDENLHHANSGSHEAEYRSHETDLCDRTRFSCHRPPQYMASGWRRTGRVFSPVVGVSSEGSPFRRRDLVLVLPERALLAR